jgi:methyl-accepting chemotaxis protein
VKTAMGSQLAMEQIRAASQRVNEMISGVAESMAQQVAAILALSKSLTSVREMSLSITAATEEQSTNSRQVSKAVENVNEITQAAASASEEMTASTVQLSLMAQELQKLVGQFKIAREGEEKGEPQVEDSPPVLALAADDENVDAHVT